MKIYSKKFSNMNTDLLGQRYRALKNIRIKHVSDILMPCFRLGSLLRSSMM